MRQARTTKSRTGAASLTMLFVVENGPPICILHAHNPLRAGVM